MSPAETIEKLLARVETLEVILEGLLSRLEESDAGEKHRGFIFSAQTILLNDPTVYGPTATNESTKDQG